MISPEGARLVWNDVHSGHSFVWREGEWLIEYDDCGHETERHNMVTIVRAYIEDLKRGQDAGRMDRRN